MHDGSSHEIDVATLQKERDELAAAVEKLAAEREEYRKLYLAMLEQCRKLELGILGQKSERLPENEAQLSLSILAMMLGRERGAELPAPPAQKVAAHERRRPTGRRKLPGDLPRVEIEIIPPEVQAKGLDAFERIGEDVTETVERRPASVVVVRMRKPKFVPKNRERNAETQVLQAETPELPIERGMAGPGFLADTIVKRWVDHLPLNRLEQVYAREGLELARSTICGWHEKLADLCRPVVAAMWKDALNAPYLCTDATGVLVQALERCRRGHFWVVVAPERHVLFGYTAKHDKAAVDRYLADYKGYLVADAHAVYDHLYAKGDVIEVACWAHLRRYFFKALTTDPERARKALALIGGLFRLERAWAREGPLRRKELRQKEAKPIVEAFFDWCDEEVLTVLDETPIAKGIGYARNQRIALERFLEDGRLPIHNNFSELQLRRQAVGRKNWLFVGSDEAGEVNATFVSLVASCRLHGIEPWSYLRDLLCLLPSWPKRRVLELAPANWQQTFEQPDTQERLGANVYRRVTLGEFDEHWDTK